MYTKLFVRPPSSASMTIPRWQRLRWEVILALFGEGVLVLFALGINPSPLPLGPFATLPGYFFLYTVPGYVMLRVLLPRARFDSISFAAFGTALGTGMLTVPLMLMGPENPPTFRVLLLLLAVWQGVLLTIMLRRPAAPAPPLPTIKLAAMLTAAVVVVIVVGVVGAFAFSGAADPVYLGDLDKIAHASAINQIHDSTGALPRSQFSVPARAMHGTWAYSHALVAWVAGIEPHQMLYAQSAGAPLLLVMLSFCTLAYEIMQRWTAAFLSVGFTLLHFLSENARIGYVTHELGERMLRNIVQDKYFSVYILVPPALALTLHLIDRTQGRGWVAVAVMGAGIVGTHPLGMGLYLMVASAYLLLHTRLNPTRRARLALGLMAATALVAVVLLVWVFPSIRIHALTDWAGAALNSGGSQHVQVGVSGAYILHPLHVSAPLSVAGIGLGLLMATRAKDDRAARYLFAATAAPLLLVFTPYVASILGNLLQPHNLERLLWLLPMGMAIAWTCTLGVDWLQAQVPRLRQGWPALPLILLVLLIIPAYQVNAARHFDRSQQPAWAEYVTPEMRALASALAPLASPESPLLAPAAVSAYLPLVLSKARVYHHHTGLSQLYHNPWWGADASALWHDFQPIYLVVECGSPQHTFAALHRFERLYENAHYIVYAVSPVWEPSLTDQAHLVAAHLNETRPDWITAYYHVPLPEDGTDWPDAVTLYEAALEANPGDLRAMRGLADVLLQLEQPARAEPLYRTVLDAAPEAGWVREGLAAALTAQGRMDEAIAVLKTASDPALLDTPYLAALDEATLEAALGAWAAAPTSGPHTARILAQRLLDTRADIDRARRILADIAPGYRTSDDLQLIAGLYLLVGQPDAALSAYRADNGRSVRVLALYHLLRGHLTGDPDAFRASIAAQPTASAYVFLGRALEEAGDLAGAKDAYHAAETLDLPDAFWGAAELVRFHAEHGDPDSTASAYAHAADMAEAMDIPSFSVASLPRLVAPGASAPYAAIPGNIALLRAEVLNRTLDPTARITTVWQTYELGEAAAWWQFKLVQGDAVYGEISQAAIAAVGAAVAWPSEVPAFEDALPPLVATVQAVAMNAPGGYRTYDIGSIMLSAPPPPAEAPQTETSHHFGDAVVLEGFTLDGKTLKLFWRASDTPPRKRWTVFVHLTDTEGSLAGQADAPPQYPTNLWEAGAHVLSVHDLPIDDLAAGTYPVEVGLYMPASGARLPVGERDAVTLLALEVE